MMRNHEVIRVIPYEEVRDTGHYSDMAELSLIFNHDVVEVRGGAKVQGGERNVWRWRPNNIVTLVLDDAPWYAGTDYNAFTKIVRGSLSLNDFWHDFHKGRFTCEELMKFYMGIGYSLCGYGEVFGQKEASDLKLSGARVRTPEDDEDSYVQTPIDYMIEKYKGQVLKL